MMEIPEALTLARQVGERLAGLEVLGVQAAASPHKFAWYHGDPAEYPGRLAGRRLVRAAALAGRVEMDFEGSLLQVGEGATLRLYPPDAPRPAKHQLLLELEDGSALVGTVTMYGMFLCYEPGGLDGEPYYEAARGAVPPLSEGFDQAYFDGLLASAGGRLTAKAFLATEQRIPGLGNGVLQDILLNARVHPRRRMDTLGAAQLAALLASVKSTLAEMASAGGRDTERDLYGDPGGYATKMSRLAMARGCPVCQGEVAKQSYLGGSVYFCPRCQEL